MHDIRFIRENPEAFDKAIASRQKGNETPAKDLIALDDARRAAIHTLETAQARRNAASKEIGAAMGRKDTAAAETLKAEVAALKDRMAEAEAAQAEAEKSLEAKLATIPNMPLAEVPVGADEAGNVEVRKWGEVPKFDFAPKQHFELGEALGMMDFEAATRMSGSRFVVLKGKLARLERALGQFMLNLHVDEHGYSETQAPLLVKDQALYGTAQLPKFREDLFSVTGNITETEVFHKYALSALDKIRIFQEILAKTISDAEVVKELRSEYLDNALYVYGTIRENLALKEFSLIPTSEVSMTNLVMGQIVDEAELPYRFTGLTPCFRSEAGSAGRDTRGMLRQHQFNKVEMVSITTPEQSLAEHERMTKCAEKVLELLEIPYRTVVLCTGDMGFSAQKTYDIEAWLPGQDTYREISSCSVCGDFQARRMNARSKAKDAKGTRFVHTLNGSGVAVGRALIAVMENYQNADGSITVPEVLRPYMGGVTRIEKA